MVKTRSKAAPFHASSSSAQMYVCCSSSPPTSSVSAPCKSKRRRAVAKPERKRKSRQKQNAIAKAFHPVLPGETGKKRAKSARHSSPKRLTLSSKPRNKLKPDLNPNPKAACKSLTGKGFKNNRNDLPACNSSLKASADKSATLTVEKGDNFIFSEKCTRTREKRNSEALYQATCQKVRTSEATDACSEERDHDQAIEGIHSEWTSEQDSALQSAYFRVRPSSNFWFEVSKKVPGKTANQCFDRFYSAYPTPSTAQPRSRKLASESPVRTISFSSPMPSLNSKVRFGRGKQGLLKAHQTVRHILRQQRIADGTYETDVFTAVEQFKARNPLLQDCINRAPSPLATAALKEKDTFSERSLLGTPASCFGATKSESNLWYSVSSKQSPKCGLDENTPTTRSAAKKQLLSPEVLKAERDPGRLDRFLDMLHLRRVDKRKKTAAGGSQDSQQNSKAERTFTQCVADARKAIMSDATEVLEAVRQENARMAAEEENSFLLDHFEEEESLLLLADD